nr:RNA-directed DNA polymerase, eukaryota, reverse transcriptase zinc-binding domain protein [Tanacetum cinerariifolium]
MESVAELKEAGIATIFEPHSASGGPDVDSSRNTFLTQEICDFCSSASGDDGTRSETWDEGCEGWLCVTKHDERDENTSFFHGVINKKRNLLNIRGIMVDGSWVDESSMDKQSELEGEVSNDEIKRAVWDCGTKKAPGPDGLNFGFYRRFWLAGVLGDIVNEVQSAFVADRQILDGPFILNEVIQWCKSKKKQSLVFKVEFEKAYDSVGGSMSRLHEWDEVVKRVKMRLSKWKIKSLSIGGRLTLLKWVLGSMTIFNMSIFKVPLGVLRTLESIQSHFFNGHALGSNKASWVSWKKVLSSKDKGGLGFSSLYALNRGLLFKWIWRFYTQDKSLWVRVIKAMHGDKGKIDAEVKTGSRSCWLNIVHEAKILTQKGITLRDFMRMKLGNGENTSFWKDCWIEGDSLRNRFPLLYTLESCKWITVGEKMRQPSLEFSNTRGAVEQEQLGDLVTLMHDVSLSPMADRWTWALENSGEFTVSSVRKHIDDKLIPGVGSKTRWIKYVPIKVNVNAWKVKLDVFPTRFNVSRRGIHIDSIMCAVCDQ